jgi:hypothetical protein
MQPIIDWYQGLPDKVKKILKGALIAALGLLATFLEQQIPGINFGKYAVYAVALNSIIVNALKQYVLYSSVK